jgi:hypothetical protein
MKVIITLSKTFLKGHLKAGQQTNFREKLLHGIGCPDCNKERGISCYYCVRGAKAKIHTCRSNYEYWKKKIDRLKDVNGVLSVRQWSEKPYHSPQEIIIDIPASEIDVQELTFFKDRDGSILWCPSIDGKFIPFETLANNDGLSLADFKSWFKNYDLSQPMAIIYFTKFRY